ncbi:hypothetical protein [Brucella anthropi]|uniref:hypothetical protein n=1 Tax=Brucella anthropi TaxID=529 RepID=UPI00236186EF|nr:hypothetical protein [Brucella anthropi]
MFIYDYVAEAFIPNLDIKQASRIFYLKYKTLIVSINISDRARQFEFGEGRVILSSATGGLHLCIKAVDLATFHGIRTLIQIGFGFNEAGANFITWTPASRARFRIADTDITHGPR